jgi:hypothetical protein
MMAVRTAAAVVAVLLAAGIARGQKAGDSAPTEAPATPAKQFDSLLLDREVPFTPPQRSPRTRPASEKADLAPDGSSVVGAAARLGESTAEGWRLIQIAGENEPRRALPSEALEQMEKIAAESPDARFEISGENTTYGPNSYLLVTELAILREEPPAGDAEAADRDDAEAEAPAPPAAAPAASQPGEERSADQAATTRPGGHETDADAEPSASSDDIIRQLRRDRPPRAVILEPEPTVPKAEDAPAVAPGPRREPLAMGRGRMVINRAVYIVPDRDGRWLEARFIGDNTLREPPMRLLPNRELELVQARREAREVPTRFEVTGLTTRYRGRTYLLLRKAMVQRDLDQF